MSIHPQSKKKQALKLLANNQIPEARDLFEQICKFNRKDIDAWMHLANIYAHLGNPAAVERCSRTIISILPELLEAHLILGKALLLQGKREDAAESFRHTLKLQPNHPWATFQLGKTLHLQARFDEALLYYKKALKLEPDSAEIRHSIESILKYQDKPGEAAEFQTLPSQVKSNYDRAHSDLLLYMNYSHRFTAKTIYQEHVHWGSTHKLLSAPLSSHKNDPDPSRKLRIGYVSPDFCKHSIPFFFEPLLAHHDTTGYETFCYSDVVEPDSTTRRLQTKASRWRNIHNLDNRQLIDKILQDGIDILVDLAGHTANSRLLAFTAKPAPVQVSYLGYPNTTGIPGMDYRLTDAWADPPGITDDYYTESLIRLPGGFLCYLPPDEAPLVTTLPAVLHGNITFCSFNNLDKITPEVVSLWSLILQAIPDSRLVIKNISLKDKTAQDRLYKDFAANRIASDRLDLLGPIYDINEHLECYNNADIALDTFPYNGTTTTCEALWMGVPVITLAGTMHAGRVGVSLLSQTGLTDLIATSPQDYVRIAVELASDQQRLLGIRTTLRERMSRSSLCNGEEFARKVENAYRNMWKKWCEGSLNGEQ